ncbi:hypothetical protein H9L14_03685 [Sphingomonas sediminicola]|uniref:CHASE domain-containing protein n=1 Tax=Sphingomonas sediminicola TaxID=386874 RepID=A0ABX6T956_9SPHN|nr:hypothetical protein [Sphingomonas sediminicola]QNP46315.1 hypothetical protein H9L14_03685 [Sphingomonas sediminicola]
MRIRLPRPLKGWRVFAGEVGVIVLGVLLALGAQQLAENLQMRAEVREFRRTIDHEIGLNLFVYDVRSRGSACNMRRIKELLNWVRKAQDGQELPQISVYGAPTMAPYRSAWDSRDGTIFAYVPAKARQKYAEFYDELDGNSKRLEEEGEAWLAIKGYELAGPVSIDDRRAIYRNLAMAYSVDRTWAGNMPVSKKIADELGISPVQPDNLTKEFLAEIDLCESIFVPKRAIDSGSGAAKS